MDDEELERLAEESEGEFVRRKRVMTDFRYDEQQEKYWDTTSGILLGAKSVDGAIHIDDWPTREDARTGLPRPYSPAKAINAIDTGLTVEGSTWWPGEDRFIRDVLVSERGAMRMRGACCYNSYIGPDHENLRDDRGPDEWIQHCKKIFPEPLEHDHFFDFCAHMLQRPDEKVNHGIVIAGSQGIGKDTALMPVRLGVGEWNAAEIGPDAIHESYNGFIKSVLLVINEVRPHDEDHRASNFYNMLKPYLAAPPEMLPMTIKYANTIYIRNLCHVVLTTNDPLSMYIPPEDRRLFVITSPIPDPKEQDVFGEGYFDNLYEYLEDGGADAVVKWLLSRDISQFNSSAPPPMTHGKKSIIESAHQVRRTVIDEVFESYCDRFGGDRKPRVIFHRDLSDFIRHSNLFDDENAAIRKLNAKNFHFKMGERGYDMWRNPEGAEWKHNKYRTRVAFVCKSVPRGEQLEVIKAALVERPLKMD